MVEALGNSRGGMLLLEVEAVLAPDDRSKGVLKTGRVTGNPTIGLAKMLGGTLVIVVDVGELLVNRVTGVLETVVDVTGMSEASAEGTLTDTVVTGGPDTSGGGLVTTGEVAAATGGSTVRGVESCVGLLVSMALATSIIALCTLSLNMSACSISFSTQFLVSHQL